MIGASVSDTRAFFLPSGITGDGCLGMFLDILVGKASIPSILGILIEGEN
jgi:hypothetical protein